MREAAERERDKWYDCHAGPGTASEACGACVTCLGRELDAAEAALDAVEAAFVDLNCTGRKLSVHEALSIVRKVRRGT